MPSTTTHVVPPTLPHTHTIIFLHGCDSTAHEFAAELFESQASDDRSLPQIFRTVKWVFPTAPLLLSTRFNTELSQWFDIWSFDSPEEKKDIQLPGLASSIPSVLDIVREEGKEVALDKIILAGISQGCATALLALLCGGVRLGGFVGISSWMPMLAEVAAVARQQESGGADLAEQIKALLRGDAGSGEIRGLGHLGNDEDALKTPGFLGHCTDDEVVPIRNGHGLRETLQKLGMDVTLKAYEEGGHWVNEPQGIDDIVEFLNRCMKT